jgi:hypothetical protein
MAGRQSSAERFFVVVALALVLTAVDLGIKTSVPTAPLDFHERSQLWVVGSFLLLVAALALAFLPSRPVTLAAGVLSGGVIGDLGTGSSPRAGGSTRCGGDSGCSGPGLAPLKVRRQGCRIEETDLAGRQELRFPSGGTWRRFGRPQAKEAV